MSQQIFPLISFGSKNWEQSYNFQIEYFLYFLFVCSELQFGMGHWSGMTWVIYLKKGLRILLMESLLPEKLCNYYLLWNSYTILNIFYTDSLLRFFSIYIIFSLTRCNFFQVFYFFHAWTKVVYHVSFCKGAQNTPLSILFYLHLNLIIASYFSINAWLPLHFI